MKRKLPLAAFAAIALTVALPVVQALVPAVGSSAVFARNGADDGLRHDANDDHGGQRGGHGADDGAGHDAHDDHGGQRGGKK